MISDDEKEVCEHLADAWNDYLLLAKRDRVDDAEMRDAIHKAQNVIAMRIARRCDPEFWR